MVQDIQSSSLKILLTEDHPDSANVMRIMLERSGFTVKVARSVADALRAADAEKFDLSVCDLLLPDGDGAQLNRQLLARHNLSSICLSGNSPDDHPVDVSAFAAYLTKPIDLTELVQTICELTGGPAKT